MFLWKFPCGYAKIEVMCARPERFVNEAIACGLSLHNMERVSRDTMKAIVPVTQYDAFSELGSQIGAAVRSVRRGGLSVLISSLVSRGALVLSMLAAVILMSVLSSRILLFSIDGADARLEEQIRSFVESEVFTLGMSPSDIDAAETAKRIEQLDPRIGIASIGFDGVIMRVSVYTRDASGAQEEEAPSSIFADKDCVILSIAALDGREEVGVGAAVKKDQLLVNGDVTPPQGGEAVLVHSRAEIIGEVAYRFNVRVEPVDAAPERSGMFQNTLRAELFGLCVESRSGYSDCERVYERLYSFDAAFLPLHIRGGKAYELVLGQRAVSKEAMMAEAERKIKQAIMAAIPEDAVIVSKSTEFFREQDGALIAVAAVHTYEKIGYTRYL